MTLTTAWKAWRESGRERRQAESLARNSFVLAYPERNISWVCKPERSTLDDSWIVVICWDWGGVPPNRTWWRVHVRSQQAVELSGDDAGRHIVIQPWR
jgi:hypothetical protein